MGARPAALSRLIGLGLELGSDVPVFLQGRNAFATGRGEVLEPIELPQRWFVVVQPPVAISTREIFGAPELRSESARCRRTAGATTASRWCARATRKSPRCSTTSRHWEAG